MVVLSIAMVLVAVLLSFGFLYWLWQTLRWPRTRVPSGAGPATGTSAELRAVATITGLPWAALASNSLNPVFRIEPQQLVFRVLRRHQRPHGDICEVDVREAYGTFNLVFACRDSPLTFVANVGTAARGAQALALLPDSVPLSARARSAAVAV